MTRFFENHGKFRQSYDNFVKIPSLSKESFFVSNNQHVKYLLNQDGALCWGKFLSKPLWLSCIKIPNGMCWNLCNLFRVAQITPPTTIICASHFTLFPFCSFTWLVKLKCAKLIHFQTIQSELWTIIERINHIINYIIPLSRS